MFRIGKKQSQFKADFEIPSIPKRVESSTKYLQVELFLLTSSTA